VIDIQNKDEGPGRPTRWWAIPAYETGCAATYGDEVCISGSLMEG